VEKSRSPATRSQVRVILDALKLVRPAGAGWLRDI
jgi:hypothetical protein